MLSNHRMLAGRMELTHHQGDCSRLGLWVLTGHIGCRDETRVLSGYRVLAGHMVFFQHQGESKQRRTLQ